MHSYKLISVSWCFTNLCHVLITALLLCINKMLLQLHIFHGHSSKNTVWVLIIV